VIKLLERESELATVRSFVRRGGVLVVEGRSGVGKTSILDAACILAQRGGRLIFRARGSELESGFAFGIVRQLFERPCAEATRSEKAGLFRGVAVAARALVTRDGSSPANEDASFAVMHGVYWLAVNFAVRRPILLAIDDAHWGDEASLRWLAYLAGRLDGIDASLIVTLRPGEPRSQAQSLLAVRAAAVATVRPALLSEQAVASIARRTLGSVADGNMCAGIHRATGGNPFYVLELLRALKSADHPGGARAIEDAVRHGGLDTIALQLAARLRELNPHSLRLARPLRFWAMAASFATLLRSHEWTWPKPRPWRRNWSALMSSARIRHRNSFIPSSGTPSPRRSRAQSKMRCIGRRLVCCMRSVRHPGE
jgi:hypothetical protein